ncbi:MAG: hypothetical protein ACYDG2_15890 [Ruminiclostridium sp.]
MKAVKYLQLKKMLLESGIDFLETSKDETIELCNNYKDGLPEHIYILIIAIIEDLHEEQKTNGTL